MNNAGVFTLAALGITTALTAAAQTPITDLDGAAAVTIEASFAGGTGGSSVIALVQTTLDGTNWRDVARFDFSTSSATKYATVQASSAKAVTSYAALGSEGVNDGLVGNQLRAVVTSSGTYTNTTLSIRAAVRG